MPHILSDPLWCRMRSSQDADFEWFPVSSYAIWHTPYKCLERTMPEQLALTTVLRFTKRALLRFILVLGQWIRLKRCRVISFKSPWILCIDWELMRSYDHSIQLVCLAKRFLVECTVSQQIFRPKQANKWLVENLHPKLSKSRMVKYFYLISRSSILEFTQPCEL